MAHAYDSTDSPKLSSYSSEEQYDSKPKSQNPYRSLLLLRYILLNVIGFALLGVAWSQGYVHKVVNADQTYLSVVIFFVFIIGLVLCTQKLWQTNREIDALKTPEGLKSAACLLYTSPSPRDS